MRSLVRATRRLLQRSGLDVVRFDHRHHPLARRMRLLDAYRISVVIDVGANTGQYASQLRALGYRERIVSFEPLSEAYSMLATSSRDDPRWDVANLAIGERTGTATLNVSENSLSSSLLQMLPAHLLSAADSRYIRTEEVRMRTLDSIIDEYLQDGDRPFLKIDAQGYERFVLQGAAQTMHRLVGLQLEMSLTPLYEGELAFDDMQRSMTDMGFTLMSIEPGFSDPTSGRLLQLDGIFFR